MCVKLSIKIFYLVIYCVNEIIFKKQEAFQNMFVNTVYKNSEYGCYRALRTGWRLPEYIIAQIEKLTTQLAGQPYPKHPTHIWRGGTDIWHP